MCQGRGERGEGKGAEWATAGKTATKRKAEAQDTRAEVQLVCAGKSVKNLAWNIRKYIYVYINIYTYICLYMYSCVYMPHTHTVPVNTRRCCYFTTWVDFCVILVRVLKLIWLGCALGNSTKTKTKTKTKTEGSEGHHHLLCAPQIEISKATWLRFN